MCANSFFTEPFTNGVTTADAMTVLSEISSKKIQKTFCCRENRFETFTKLEYHCMQITSVLVCGRAIPICN